MTAIRRGILCLVLTLGATALRASVTVSSSIELSQLQILPSSGSVEFLSAWTSTAFAEALDNLGGFQQDFDSIDNGLASAIAATTLADAAGSASGLTLTGSAFSGVNLPGQIVAAASSTGRGSLWVSFRIVGAGGPVSVGFIASLLAGQLLETDEYGVEATSEVAFSLRLDSGDLPVFYHNLMSIGPSSFASNPFSQDVSGSATLQTDTAYLLIAELDSESRGANVPEPSTAVLLLAALGQFAVYRLRRRR